MPYPVRAAKYRNLARQYRLCRSRGDTGKLAGLYFQPLERADVQRGRIDSGEDFCLGEAVVQLEGYRIAHRII